jgi:hypothetical protein
MVAGAGSSRGDHDGNADIKQGRLDVALGILTHNEKLIEEGWELIHEGEYDNRYSK